MQNQNPHTMARKRLNGPVTGPDNFRAASARFGQISTDAPALGSTADMTRYKAHMGPVKEDSEGMMRDSRTGEVKGIASTPILRAKRR